MKRVEEVAADPQTVGVASSPPDDRSKIVVPPKDEEKLCWSRIRSRMGCANLACAVEVAVRARGGRPGSPRVLRIRHRQRP